MLRACTGTTEKHHLFSSFFLNSSVLKSTNIKLFDLTLIGIKYSSVGHIIDEYTWYTDEYMGRRAVVTDPHIFVG
jgi:hypothetical protein